MKPNRTVEAALAIAEQGRVLCEQMASALALQTRAATSAAIRETAYLRRIDILERRVRYLENTTTPLPQESLSALTRERDDTATPDTKESK